MSNPILTLFAGALIASSASASCLTSVQTFLGLLEGETLELKGTVVGVPGQSCSATLKIRSLRLYPSFEGSKERGLKPDRGGAFWPFSSFSLYPSQLQSGEIWECKSSPTTLILRDRSRQASGRFLDIGIYLQKGPRPNTYRLSYGEAGMSFGSFSTTCDLEGQIQKL